MKNKKLIVIMVVITILAVAGIFLAWKISSYLALKNDCLRINSKPGGYSVSIYFKSDTPQADIDKFINEAKRIANVKNIKSKNKDEALQEFIKKQGGRNPEIIKSLNELGYNPLSSSITINSDISDIEQFLSFEQSILDKINSYGLEVISHDDGNLKFFLKELAKVKSASLMKDLPNYIFSGEDNHFFERKYSIICNPNFPRK